MNKLLVAVMLLAFQGAAADTLSGRVVGVADGDTLTVLDQKHEQHKVRLSGIDAPEKSQPFSQQAKQSLSGLAYGHSVSVDWRKRDRYRRIVGKVFKGCMQPTPQSGAADAKRLGLNGTMERSQQLPDNLVLDPKRALSSEVVT